MAAPIERFSFDPPNGWNDPTVFPTYEENEEQVRADLQRLHNQTRDYLNDQLLQSVDEAIADMEEYVDEAVEHAIVGQIPDDSLTATKLKAGAGSNGNVLTKDSSAAGGMKWSAMDLSSKQDKITASGILKGNGSGGVSAAVKGTDYAPGYTYSTTDLTPGVSDLETGKLYFVYE